MTNNVVFITGAGGDIGSTTALELGKNGYHIACVDIDETRCEQTLTNLKENNINAIAITADVTSENDVNRAIKQTHHFGKVVGIVNNAGMAYAPTLKDCTYQQWQFEQALNLNSAFLVIKGFEQYLIKNGGAIVNVSSVNGLGTYGNPAYSVAKAGLIHYTKMLSTELGRYGVRANCVAPGTVRTRAWDERAQHNPEVWDEVKKWYALERISMPQDIANVIAFLISDKSSAITGITLPVDCGLSAGIRPLAQSFSQSDY